MVLQVGGVAVRSSECNARAVRAGDAMRETVPYTVGFVAAVGE